MKRIYLLITAIIVMAWSTGIQNAKAQSDVTKVDVEWEKHSISIDEAVGNTAEDLYFLYNVNAKVFLHVGSTYGMHGIGADTGIPFNVEKKTVQNTTTYYLFKTTIENTAQGSYIGVDSYEARNTCAFADRSGSDDNNLSQWSYTNVSASGNTYTYRFENRGKSGYYLAYGEHAATVGTGETSAKSVYIKQGTDDTETVWAIIPLSKFKEVITEYSQNTSQTNIDVTGLLRNPRFIRNAQSGVWKFIGNTADNPEETSCAMDSYIGGASGNDNYAINKGAFGALEIDNGQTETVRQRVYNIEPGLYAVEAQGFFYDENDPDASSTAYLFAAEGENRQFGMLFSTLTTDERTDFKGKVEQHKSDLGSLASDYFRMNVPAAEFLAKGLYYTADEKFKRNIVYITVEPLSTTENVEIADDFDGKVTIEKGKGYITVGISKQGETGYAFMDNIKLYYLGNNEFGVDAYNTDNSKVDVEAYELPRRFNLSRDFKLNKTAEENNGEETNYWEPLILPVDLYAAHIKEIFGENAKLSKLFGENPNNSNQILFKAVDLSDETKKVVEAGGCYLVKVFNGPTVPRMTPYTFKNNAFYSDSDQSGEVTYPYGTVYHFGGVTRSQEQVNTLKATGDGKYGEGTTEDGKLHYKGYYYRNLEGAPAYSYVMSGGKMYHLGNENWTKLMGTCWYLTDLKASAARPSMTMVIAGENGETTDITGIVTEFESTSLSDGVYNLNGQKINESSSPNGLPKGIYIINGKKRIVR